jgi:hypothetical protein
MAHDLLGTCLLVPPQPTDYELKESSQYSANRIVFRPRRWVACLFTSNGYGNRNAKTKNPGKDKPSDIIKNTRAALADFRRQLDSFDPVNFTEANGATDDERPGAITAVKFNSGAFNVPWDQTEALIKEVFGNFGRGWYIYDGVPQRPPPQQVRKQKNPRGDGREVEKGRSVV